MERVRSSGVWAILYASPGQPPAYVILVYFPVFTALSLRLWSWGALNDIHTVFGSLTDMICMLLKSKTCSTKVYSITIQNTPRLRVSPTHSAVQNTSGLSVRLFLRPRGYRYQLRSRTFIDPQVHSLELIILPSCDK